jgi:hypothetical protein
MKCPCAFIPSGPNSKGKAWLVLALGLLVAGLAAGCGTVQAVAERPGKTASVDASGQTVSPADPVVVQQSLLRLADELTTQMTGGFGQLRRGSDPLPPAEVLQMKIAYATATSSIASGANPIANLLDMTVFVGLTRMALEGHWLPTVFGASAQSLLESCQSAEAEAWRLTATVLTPEQQAELRAGMAAWQQQNPRPASVVGARASGFATQVVAREKADNPRGGSVFSILRIDPLSGLDPAAREIAQTRLFAERALYVMQHLPPILRWQLELLSVNTLDQPALQQLVANTTQLTAAVDRVSRVAEQLPAQIDRQRQAITQTLEEQEKQLTPLIAEANATLATGREMSASLNTTLTTFDALMKRFGVGEPQPPGPAAPAGEPFRIQDYTQTAAQLEVTAKQLTLLLREIDQTLASPNLAKLSAQVAPVVQQAQASGKEVVDYAFWRGLLLVAAVLAAALVYRVVAGRLGR